MHIWIPISQGQSSFLKPLLRMIQLVKDRLLSIEANSAGLISPLQIFLKLKKKLHHYFPIKGKLIKFMMNNKLIMKNKSALSHSKQTYLDLQDRGK